MTTYFGALAEMGVSEVELLQKAIVRATAAPTVRSRAMPPREAAMPTRRRNKKGGIFRQIDQPCIGIGRKIPSMQGRPCQGGKIIGMRFAGN
mgnify:CR=1 FL=1